MADAQLELFHAWGSFFSIRARIAFRLKKIPFKSIVIPMHTGEVLKPYYLHMNPGAQVPVLRQGEKIIADSRDIIEYVDTLPSDEPKIVPDPSSEEGALVNHYVEMLNDLNLPLISYGSLIFRDELTDGTAFPPRSLINAEKNRQMWQRNLDFLATFSEKYPEMKDVYQAKVPFFSYMRSMDNRKEEVLAELEKCDKVFEEIEKQLEKMNGGNTNGETWLCTSNPSTADIFLAVLLQRLIMIGQGSRFFTGGKRPHVEAYFKRCQNFPAFYQELKWNSSVFWLVYGLVGDKITPACTYALAAVAIGTVVGVGYKRGWFDTIGEKVSNLRLPWK